ncbi:MAG: fumarate hydratase [Deltaproteobacteria bacterium]|nr:fumarate hydratase [Deltaproteobacteria bacterium]MBW1949357.1 fumarate hydratase [Deltaproteobacteria bacterium]MBW2007277.1 fumarate hydratase [Deltaproteobacteria bacterium]MBW2347717.1 fumarate hydratase [Deltaproteobacteria bacterium]
MRRIMVDRVREAVREAAARANFELGADTVKALEAAREREESAVGKEILERLLENAEIARTERIPMCQDTGLAVLFVELGQEVLLEGGEFNAALEEGIRLGYEEAYLRKSVCHPFTRANTGDNTPVIIHTEIVPGDRLKIWVVPKGGGSENMSRLFMLPPSAGWQGIKKRIVETVVEAGPNPCPPTILGIGIGGNFEGCALLAKKALLRPAGMPHPDPDIARKEQEILEEVNASGVGPQGLGGRVTSLAAHILMMPCHIASLPVAINLQCHANRHVEIEL